MADDLSLLFRLRGDAAGLKTATAEGRAAVNQLKQSFGPELTQTVNLANRAFVNISDNLNTFVAQRVPLVGNAFARVTDGLRGMGRESASSERAIAGIAKSIQSIATESGKSVPQIASFLTKFAQIEGQAKRDKAAIDFFGAALGAKLLPELEKTGTALATVATESAGAGASIAAMAGPIGIAVAAFAAMAVGALLLSKELFALAKSAAAFQGKLFDLSQQTGVSVETLSALEVVARTTGSSVDALAQSLGIFQRRLEEAQDPSSKAGKLFKELGVEAIDTEQALRDTLKALAEMPEGFQQTALALEVFGRGGKSFLAIAKEANGDIDEITRKLGGLGLVTTEQAKLADEFNDQLVILDVQMRGIGTEAIPVVLDAMKDLSRELKQNRDLFIALQGAVKGLTLGIVVPLRLAVGIIKTEFEKAKTVLEITVALFERMAKAIEFISGHPIKLPDFPSAATTAPSTKPESAPAPGKDPFTKQLEEQIASLRRLQAVNNVVFEERKRQAEAAIAFTQREFEAGRATREELLQVTLVNNRKRARAETDALTFERTIKLKEFALAKDDEQKRAQLANALLEIDAQIANKRADLRRTQADLTAKSQLDERKDLLAHEQAQLDLLAQKGREKIARIEQEIREDVSARQAGLEQIKKIEDEALRVRGQLLKRELELAGVGPDRQAVLDKIKALETERTALERQQSERRKQISRDEFETKRSIALAEIDTLLEIEEIRAERLIAANEALAEARIQSEEDAARKILVIRLRLIDSEIEAIETRLKAAASITDVDERLRTEAEINNQLRILREQRVTIETEGEREINEAQQRDLQNLRRYADELKEIRERIIDVERDAAREVLNLMQLNFTRRRDIVRAQLQLDLADENSRHQQALETIRQLEQENRESNRTAEEKLEAEKEINRLREAEAERHRLAMAGINAQAKQDEADATPFGRLGFDIDGVKEFGAAILDSLLSPIETLKAAFRDLQGAAREFVSEIGASVVPFGDILRGTFFGVAEAIGQTVANWVLLGETGPAVMRKILAQALASLAAEATVQAVKELALGFATLFFNPAESAGHFVAAGLWASIAGGSALGGRALAGNLFKKPEDERDRGRSGGGSTGRDEPRPIDLIREQLKQELHIFVHGEPGGRFNEAVIVASIDDVRSNGPLRTTIKEAGKD